VLSDERFLKAVKGTAESMVKTLLGDTWETRDKDERQHMVETMCSDLVTALTKHIRRDARSFKKGRRVKKSLRWTGGMEGLIKMSRRYMRKLALRVTGKEWTQYRPEEMVRITDQTEQFVDGESRARTHVGRSTPEMAESTRLLCPVHKVLEDAVLVDAVSLIEGPQYRLACGVTRAADGAVVI